MTSLKGIFTDPKLILKNKTSINTRIKSKNDILYVDSCLMCLFLKVKIFNPYQFINTQYSVINPYSIHLIPLKSKVDNWVTVQDV